MKYASVSQSVRREIAATRLSSRKIPVVAGSVAMTRSETSPAAAMSSPGRIGSRSAGPGPAPGRADAPFGGIAKPVANRDPALALGKDVARWGVASSRLPEGGEQGGVLLGGVAKGPSVVAGVGRPPRRSRERLLGHRP